MTSEEKAQLGAKICKWWTSIDDKHILNKSFRCDCIEYCFIKNYYSKEFIEKNKDKGLITGEIIATFSYTSNEHSKEEVDVFFHANLVDAILTWSKYNSVLRGDFMYLKCNSCDELNVKLDFLEVE